MKIREIAQGLMFKLDKESLRKKKTKKNKQKTIVSFKYNWNSFRTIKIEFIWDSKKYKKLLMHVVY